jgi:hypothetical protein
MLLGVVGAESAAAASGAALLLALLMLSSAAAGEVRLASTLAGSMLLQERPIRLDELCKGHNSSSSSSACTQQSSSRACTAEYIRPPHRFAALSG